MRALFSILLFLQALMLAGCPGTGLDDRVKKNPIETSAKPLDIGNSWTYYTGYLEPDGSVFHSDTITHFITRDTILLGEKWFVEQEGESDPPVISIYQNREDGLWKYITGSNGDAMLIALYPAVPDSEYLVSSFTSGGKMFFIRRKIEMINKRVEVPAGQFNCIKYTDRLYNSSDSVIREPLNVLYYSPSAGLIRSEKYQADGSVGNYPAVLTELTSFHLKSDVVK